MLLVIQKGSWEAGLGTKWGEGMNGLFHVYEEEEKKEEEQEEER